jgi:hypothetical protein
VCHSMENTAIYSVFASSPVSCMPRVMSHGLHSYYGSTCQRMTPIVHHGLTQAIQEHYWQSYVLLSQAGAPFPYQYIKEGKSPDDKQSLHFVQLFLQISIFSIFFPISCQNSTKPHNKVLNNTVESTNIFHSNLMLCINLVYEM